MANRQRSVVDKIQDALVSTGHEDLLSAKDRGRRYLDQLSPHVRVRLGAKIIEDLLKELELCVPNEQRVLTAARAWFAVRSRRGFKANNQLLAGLFYACEKDAKKVK